MSPWLSDLFLNSQSDDRLVGLAATGHPQAFAAIVRRYRRELVRRAQRLSSPERAEDVVQQTFLSAFAAVQAGSEVKHLRGWLHAILRHEAVRITTRPAEAEISEASLATGHLEDAVTEHMVALEALAEISRLPDNQRAALVGTALEGRSRTDMAKMLGLSEGAVRQLVHRARTTVRTAVTAITPFPLLRWLAARSRAAWSEADLIAGAGGASSGAITIKLAVLAVAGLGVAGATGLRPHLGHDPSGSAAHAAAGPPRTPSSTSLLTRGGSADGRGRGATHQLGSVALIAGSQTARVQQHQGRGNDGSALHPDHGGGSRSSDRGSGSSGSSSDSHGGPGGASGSSGSSDGGPSSAQGGDGSGSGQSDGGGSGTSGSHGGGSASPIDGGSTTSSDGGSSGGDGSDGASAEIPTSSHGGSSSGHRVSVDGTHDTP